MRIVITNTIIKDCLIDSLFLKICMMKKIISALFILSLLPIIYFVLFKKDVNDIYFYYLTMGTLMFGVVLYPFNLNFSSKKDFLIFPVIVYLIFSILNIFLIKSFDDKIAIVNLLIGLFSFGQYYLQQKSKHKNFC